MEIMQNIISTSYMVIIVTLAISCCLLVMRAWVDLRLVYLEKRVDLYYTKMQKNALYKKK